MISVLISTINDPYLNKTVENLRQNADGELEFIIINDGGSPVSVPDATVINHSKMLGRRISFNQAAKMAQGDFLFVIDSHCSMSKGWDTKMAESVNANNLVFCVIRDMDAQTWRYKPGDYLHVCIDQTYTEKWWNKKPLKECDVEEESIAITGCAWMVTKEQWNRLGGYDECLGEYGWDGPEWSMKIWLEGNGRVILRTDVICGHIFGTNEKGKQYQCKMIPKAAYVRYMNKRYGSKILSLIERFGDVPYWTQAKKGTTMQTEKEEHTITHNITHTTVDKKTNTVIKIVNETWEYIYEGELDESKATKEWVESNFDKFTKVYEEVYRLINGKLQLCS